MPTLKLTLSQETKDYLAELIQEGLDSPSFVMTQEHWDQLDMTIAKAGKRVIGDSCEVDELLREALREPSFAMTLQHWQDLKNQIIERSPDLQDELRGAT